MWGNIDVRGEPPVARPYQSPAEMLDGNCTGYLHEIWSRSPQPAANVAIRGVRL